jgi:hypothetical protein
LKQRTGPNLQNQRAKLFRHVFFQNNAELCRVPQAKNGKRKTEAFELSIFGK